MSMCPAEGRHSGHHGLPTIMPGPMTETAAFAKSAPRQTERFDVVIVEAVVSGVGGAYHLTKQCPGNELRRPADLQETSAAHGACTVIRASATRWSDSDLYTFGYRFKPWTSAPIATAAEILRYVGEVIDENDLGSHIRYRHEIVSASWSSDTNLWTLEATRTDTGEPVRIAANFLWMGQGYYRHAQGYTHRIGTGWEPSRGRDRSPAVASGRPGLCRQDCCRHRLGRHRGNAHSGDRGRLRAYHDAATVADLVQDGAQCDRAGRHELRELDIDEAWIHAIVRKKILHDVGIFASRSFSEPEAVKQELLAAVRGYLEPEYDVETHFTPRYRPWRQPRRCLHPGRRPFCGNSTRQGIGASPMRI